jgi:hypothetical protein
LPFLRLHRGVTHAILALLLLAWLPLAELAGSGDVIPAAGSIVKVFCDAHDGDAGTGAPGGACGFGEDDEERDDTLPTIAPISLDAEIAGEALRPGGATAFTAFRLHAHRQTGPPL